MAEHIYNKAKTIRTNSRVEKSRVTTLRSKVGFTLQALGMAVLLASAVIKLPLFFPVFGFGALCVGAHKVIIKQ